jgi:hypothetical protein
MRFNITVIDPPGYPYTHFLFPLCKLLSCGLESLGHSCHITRNSIGHGRLTIVVGGHLLTSIEDVVRIARSGEYIVYQTENIKHGVVSFAGKGNTYHSVFVPLLARARMVWEIVSPTSLSTVANLGGRAHLLLGGYHAAMEEVIHKREKDIDFLFIGSVTAHRRTLLDSLTNRGHRVATLFSDDTLFRNDLIARSRVHVSMKQSNDIDHLPWPRHTYLLNNKCLIVSERCMYQEWLQDCFLWTETNQWADLCEQTLARADREQLAAEFYERFKQLPFTKQLEQALEAL